MGIKTAGKFYTDTTTAIPIAQNALFTFASSNAAGCVGLSSDKSTIKITKPGLYRVCVNVTYEVTEAGVVEASLLSDGSAVLGAKGSETAATVGSLINVAFTTLVRVFSTCSIGDTAKLTLVNSGVASSYTVDNIIVERVA